MRETQMPINLLQALPSCNPREDREDEIAFLRTRTPELGSAAYLHVVYKPANRQLMDAVAGKLAMPDDFVHFLRVQNGAFLFSNSLHVFGVVPKAELLKRNDPSSLPPFNIEWENANLREVY